MQSTERREPIAASLLRFRSHGFVDLAGAPETFRQLRAKAASYAEVTDTRQGARFDLGYAAVDCGVTATRLTIALSATDAGTVGALQAMLAEQLGEWHADTTIDLHWTLQGGKPVRAYRRMTVLRVADLTPHMRRLWLAGEALEPFAENGLHVSLFFPGDTPWREPSVEETGRLHWPDGQEPPPRRAYTLRHVNLAEGCVIIDMLLHPTDGAVAPGAHFARTARPGDRVGMAGPGGGTLPPSRWLLLAGDETALPAIARMLETLPPDVTVTVRLEADGAEDELPLTSAATMDLLWLHRHGRSAATSTLLLDALRRIEYPAAGTDRFVWFAAEAGIARAAKDWLRNDAGFSPEELITANFWRV